MIEITGLEKQYDEVQILKNINLTIKKGEIFGLIGLSGAGKSTLLRCINGLVPYDRGSLKVNGIEVKDLLMRIIIPGLKTTVYMVMIATICSAILGFAIAILLYVTRKSGLHPNAGIFAFINTIVNVIRSFPFVILMVSIIPLTRFLVGTSIGENAALVPLTIASAPFMARLFETSFESVDSEVLEAAQACGASDIQIIFQVIVKESLPLLMQNLTLAVISILGFSAMAGAVGAGGLGSVALMYGYQNFNDTIMYGTVIILIILVQVIQFVGNKLYDRLK